jgi:hypothetical protein
VAESAKKNAESEGFEPLNFAHFLAGQKVALGLDFLTFDTQL